MWGVGISVDKKWVDKIYDISRKDRMIVLWYWFKALFFRLSQFMPCKV